MPARHRMAVAVRSDIEDQTQWALKLFRRKVQRAGILKDVRNKRYYVKPSTVRRLKSVAARRRQRRNRRSSS
jgi:small subunit ribosomal protein S21